MASHGNLAPGLSKAVVTSDLWLPSSDLIDIARSEPSLAIHPADSIISATANAEYSSLDQPRPGRTALQQNPPEALRGSIIGRQRRLASEDCDYCRSLRFFWGGTNLAGSLNLEQLWFLALQRRRTFHRLATAISAIGSQGGYMHMVGLTDGRCFTASNAGMPRNSANVALF